jgi:YceI-like domain
MKTITSIILLFICLSTFAQDEMITNKGIIIFEASIPLYEENKAVNESVYCILNTKTGEIKSLVLIKDFHFKISLMEEHFNENYLESNHYPKAIFIGRIQGFNWNIIGNSPKEFNIKGKLEIHGKRKEITSSIIIRKVNDNLELLSNFNIDLNDFNIKIPKILSLKIAETVNIETSYMLK